MQSPTIAKCAFSLLISLTAQSLLAQTTPPAAVPPATRPSNRIGQEPCWRQAGVPRSAIVQRRGIERGTKAQVAAVCADPALTVQQKRAKIREIRQRARQQMEALVSLEQQEAIRSCEESRGGGRHTGGGTHHGGGGPCGNMPTQEPNPPPSQPPSPGPPPQP
jgi:hypothetical protein